MHNQEIVDTVLIVSKDSTYGRRICQYLAELGIESNLFSLGKHALNYLGREDAQLVLSEVSLQDMSGFSLLEIIRQNHPNTEVVITAEPGAPDVVVKAIKNGAFDFLEHPISKEKIRSLIDKLTKHRLLVLKNLALQQQLDQRYGIGNIIGNSYGIQRVIQQIRQVAPARASVLVTGESGVGKELVAHAIHNLSPRKRGPFVRINCGAIPESLVESELFGHEKGAFTGAIAAKKGKFELADKGTLFLDEIGELPLSMQVKLLRFLEAQEFERVGGTRTHRIDARVIAATNSELADRVKDATFREDLYYRLKVVSIQVPPLRERKEDIPLLIDHFLNELCKANNKRPMNLEQDALDALVRYPWPGNVRELKNFLEGLVVMSTRKDIKLDDLPSYIRMEGADTEYLPFPKGMSLKELERQAILTTLARNANNRNETARELGISLRTLFRRLGEYKYKESE